MAVTSVRNVLRRAADHRSNSKEHPTSLGPANRAQLARDFTDEMYNGYRCLVRAVNYRPKQFLEMVTCTLASVQPNCCSKTVRPWTASPAAEAGDAAPQRRGGVLKPKYEPLSTLRSTSWSAAETY